MPARRWSPYTNSTPHKRPATKPSLVRRKACPNSSRSWMSCSPADRDHTAATAYGWDDDDTHETRFPEDCHSDRSADCDPSRSSQGDPRHVECEFCRRQWPAYLLQRAWRRQAAHSSSRGRQPRHLREHGRTPDTDRPLRCETLGDDVAALIGHLNLGKADVMGYSLGSGVALQTAIRHPDVVDRLVLVSGTMRRDGAYPEAVATFNQLEANAAMLGGSVKASPLGQAYPDVDWTNLFRKVGELTK